MHGVYRRGWSPLLGCALPLMLTGCSPYAVIERRGEPPLEGRIMTSDPTTIDVELPDGKRLQIPREAVTAIDHPGNVAMAIGLPNTVLGSLFAVITVFMLPAAIEQGWPEGDERVRAAPITLAFGLFAGANLAVGLPPFVWGSETWFESTGNAQPAERPRFSVAISASGIRVEF